MDNQTNPQCGRYAKQFAAIFILTAALLISSTNVHAAIVSSDFEAGADGWLGHACIGAGLCSVSDIDWTAQLSHIATGGSPLGGGAPIPDSGYIDLRDPGEPAVPGDDYAARLEPNPAKYAGAFSLGRTVEFDALIRTNGGGGGFDASGRAASRHRDGSRYAYLSHNRSIDYRRQLETLFD